MFVSVRKDWDGDVSKLKPEQLAKLDEHLIALQAMTPEQLAESKRQALRGDRPVVDVTSPTTDRCRLN